MIISSKKTALFLVFVLFGSNPIWAHRQPILRDGKYYFSVDDTHVHIDLQKALRFLVSKIVSPQEWIKRVTDIFYPTEQKSTVDPISVLKPAQTVPDKESIEPKITWIGHASFLIQINGFNILTDPIFGDVKAGPITLTTRTMPPGITFEKLPPIDVIVISHNHSDHLDSNTLTALAKKYDPILLVPKGDKALGKSLGFSRVQENNWWQKTPLTKNKRNITLTFLPALHWSIRFSLTSYRASLWGSWMISSGDTHLYFAGDTAYADHFKEIAQDFPCIDVALLPIGPTSTGENRHKECHVNAQEAVDAFIDLNAHCFVPMHYGTFFRGEENLENAVKQLEESWQEKTKQLEGKKLLQARCGQTYPVAESESKIS